MPTDDRRKHDDFFKNAFGLLSLAQRLGASNA